MDIDETKTEMRSLRSRMHDISNIAQNLVTRDATMAIQVSNLVTLFSEHKSDTKTFMSEARESLGSIMKQVTQTNGRVNTHDEHLEVTDRELRDIKETLAKVMWMVFGLFTTVIGGVVVFWVNNR